jgi:DNA end-binding protein Ku
MLSKRFPCTFFRFRKKEYSMPRKTTVVTLAQPLSGPPALPFNPVAAAAPRGRPSWSGLLRLSLVTVPVKAFPAVGSAATPQFNQLHADCGQRIRYEKRCPEHGPVDSAAIVRGYQYAPDQYVLVEPEELEQFRPAQDKALVLEQFVPAYHVDPSFFAGRSLYLAPDGVAAHHPYAVIAAALGQARKWALGRVILSGHRQLIVVRSVGRLLALDVLHYPTQVRAASSWEADLHEAAASAEELQLAAQLLEAGGPLDWSRYRDTNAEELAALLEAKIAGRPQAPAADPAAAVRPLLDALKQSVAAAGGRPEATSAPPRRSRSQKRIAS